VSVPPKKNNGGRIVLWVVAAVLELVIVGFAIYGVYALSTGGANKMPTDTQRPSFGQQMPGQQGGNGNSQSSNGTTSGSQDNSTSSVPSNYTKVQLGIVCVQIPDETWEKNNLTAGLMVQSISDTSNAKNTELQANDVITAANGTSVKTFEDLFAVMNELNPGDEITLTAYHLTEQNNSPKQSEAFTVKFTVQEKSSTTSSQAASDYPQA